MSTDIAVVDQPTVTADVAHDVTLVAMDPIAIKTEQSRLSKWFEQKAEIMRSDAADVKATLDAAQKEGFTLAPRIERQHKLALKRAEFYDKCKAAIDAGFCLIPNFPVQAFAIRTAKNRPTPKESQWRRETRQQESEGPSLGKGDYVDAVPFVGISHYETETGHDGKPKETPIFKATEFDDEIEFPISVAKPEIMSRTAAAMAEKCFDEIGVLPDRHVIKRDPMVVGIIRDPRSSKYHKRVLTFLIAWTVDTADL
jgi:hypothetical protein